jgi:hypothetical protein
VAWFAEDVARANGEEAEVAMPIIARCCMNRRRLYREFRRENNVLLTLASHSIPGP